jgi:hypothetical protein
MSESVSPSVAVRYFVRLPSGATYGPADDSTLVEWTRQGRIPKDAMLVDETNLQPPIPVTSHPRLMMLVAAPPTIAGELIRNDDGDATGGLIPYKNPAALIGYYTSIASLIPFFAILLGPTAIVLGCFGLKAKKANPRVRGTAHAIIAIVLGTLTTLLNVGGIVAAVLLRP